MLKRWLHDTKGATSIEYGLIVALIVIVISAAVASTGTGTTGLYTRVGTAFSTYIP